MKCNFVSILFLLVALFYQSFSPVAAENTPSKDAKLEKAPYPRTCYTATYNVILPKNEVEHFCTVSSDGNGKIVVRDDRNGDQSIEILLRILLRLIVSGMACVFCQRKSVP